METNNAADKIYELFTTSQQGEIYGKVIGYVEKMIIEQALERSSGNQIAAAKLLGVNRNTLCAKIRKLNIEVGRFRP